MPNHGTERERFWKFQREMVAKIGGVGPRRLPPLVHEIQLPRFIHVHVDNGIEREISWDTGIGVNAEQIVALRSLGCPVSLRYLAGRGLIKVPKILMVSAKDGWLLKFCRSVGPEFFDSLEEIGFKAIICPNLSAYQHVEHRVWLDNRALIQIFMEKLLERGLPSIFYSYLEDSPIHQRWLVDYFRFNPSQSFIATGFDRKKRGKSFDRKLCLLAEVEQSLGRPLRVVLNCIVSRMREIRVASGLFPGRVHLMGSSVYLKSLKGKVLTVGETGSLQWLDGRTAFRPGWELFCHNATNLEQAVAAFAPDFFRPPS